MDSMLEHRDVWQEARWGTETRGLLGGSPQNQERMENSGCYSENQRGDGEPESEGLCTGVVKNGKCPFWPEMSE